MHDKVLRIDTLKNKKAKVNESLEDAICDLINYSIMLMTNIEKTMIELANN